MTDNTREDRVAPRTAPLRTVIVQKLTTFLNDETQAVALVAEFEDRIRAEAASLDRDELRKAVEARLLATWEVGVLDVGGDDAESTRLGWNAALRTLLALLSAGDKAEAPPDE